MQYSESEAYNTNDGAAAAEYPLDRRFSMPNLQYSPMDMSGYVDMEEFTCRMSVAYHFPILMTTAPPSLDSTFLQPNSYPTFPSVPFFNSMTDLLEADFPSPTMSPFLVPTRTHGTANLPTTSLSASPAKHHPRVRSGSRIAPLTPATSPIQLARSLLYGKRNSLRVEEEGMAQTLPSAGETEQARQRRTSVDTWGKGARFRPTEEELEMLTAIFAKNPFPSSTLRQKLADRMGLDIKQVQFCTQHEHTTTRRATMKAQGIHVLKPSKKDNSTPCFLGKRKMSLTPLSLDSAYFYVKTETASPPVVATIVGVAAEVQPGVLETPMLRSGTILNASVFQAPASTRATRRQFQGRR
ncbi:hypothetical protein BC830DRAFT_1221359, partial [Chytriomyces sp. MP71]